MKSRRKSSQCAAFVLSRLVIFSALFALCETMVAGAEDRDADRGRFLRKYWYEPGIEHGNPSFNSRFRVNAPDAVLHPSFMHRSEVRGNGMMLVLIEEDLSRVAGAELYLELWGGHPGTANKRVTINGRSTYKIPEVGAEENNCTYSYPTLALKITDLVNGYNALQFACDRGKSFWGHFIVDNACLRVVLHDDHPDLEKTGFAGFEAALLVHPIVPDREVIPIELKISFSGEEKVSSVEFVGYYYGYDENGNGKFTDWHGFTKNRLPQAILGTSTAEPFSMEWDVSMLPAQKDVAVKATVHFKDHPEISYETPVLRGLRIPPRKQSRVRLYTSSDLPHPFWSRASRANECTILIDEDPEQIEKAELHVVIWDGGRGKVEHPFTFNGHPFPVAGKGHHDVLYRRLPVDPGILKQGPNRIVLLSDTDHHGIEVLLPGPAIIVRSKREDSNLTGPARR